MDIDNAAKTVVCCKAVYRLWSLCVGGYLVMVVNLSQWAITYVNTEVNTDQSSANLHFCLKSVFKVIQMPT